MEIDEGYSKEDNLAYVETLRGEVDQLYKRLFFLGVGARFHAFLEWCGVLSEHLNITKDILKQDLPAFNMNRHTGATPPVPSFRLAYMAEKMECIFDGLIEVKAVGAEAEQGAEARAFDAKLDLKKIEKRAQTQRPLEDQLRDLHAVANRLGLYDAADHIARVKTEA